MYILYKKLTLPKFSSMQIFKIFLRAISCFYINYRKLFVFLRCFSDMYACVHIHTYTYVCVYVLVSVLLLIQLCVFYNFLFNFFVQQIAVVQHFCRQTALNDRQTDVQAERLMRIYNMADMIETKHPPPKKRNFCFSLLPLEIGNCVR